VDPTHRRSETISDRPICHPASARSAYICPGVACPTPSMTSYSVFSAAVAAAAV